LQEEELKPGIQTTDDVGIDCIRNE
jgi:hypothetical protein